MRKNTIGLAEVGDMIKAITHYNQLASYFPQLDQDQKESLQAFYDRALQHSGFVGDKRHMDERAYHHWQDINLHVVKQNWGSTACGWGGMGGAAMTDSHTTIIESIWNGAAFIYYSGRLAYVVEMDDKYKELVTKGYRFLPGLTRLNEKLTVIYRNDKRG